MRIFIPRNSTSTKTTYEDLKSTGNFNLIQEIRIKGQLENYYKYLETTQETLGHLNARLGETPSLVGLREQLINYFEPVYAKGHHAIDWQWLNTPREVQFKAVEAQI